MSVPITRRQFVQLACMGAGGLALPSLAFGKPWSAGLAARSYLQFQYDPLIDLYLFLRRAADTGTTPSADWTPALTHMHQAAALVHGDRRLDLLNGLIADSHSAAELSQAVAQMPESAAGGLPLRATLQAIAESLTAAEPLYASRIGPEHRTIVEAALRDRVTPVLVPKEQACLSYILSSFEIPDPGFAIPVFPVAEAPDPGSITSRSRRLKAACFVSVVPYAGNTLLEVILHEATHALEVVAHADSSVLARLRNALQAHGVQPSDPLYHSVPHTLMFVQSAQTVRRFLDTGYTPYGRSHGYYAKLPHADVVERAWLAHLDGRISADSAIGQIVAGVTAG